jgi:lipopolysaccharide/colanic/teichoic acid biosynthesis glycosyltransferase
VRELCSFKVLMQRLLDTIFSFAALVVLAPFLLPVMIVLVFAGERGFIFSSVQLMTATILDSLNLLPCLKIALILVQVRSR